MAVALFELALHCRLLLPGAQVVLLHAQKILFVHLCMDQ